MLNYCASEGSSNKCWTPAYPSLIPKWHRLPPVPVNVVSVFRKRWPLSLGICGYLNLHMGSF